MTSEIVCFFSNQIDDAINPERIFFIKEYEALL